MENRKYGNCVCCGQDEVEIYDAAEPDLCVGCFFDKKSARERDATPDCPSELDRELCRTVGLLYLDAAAESAALCARDIREGGVLYPMYAESVERTTSEGLRLLSLAE